MKVKCHCPHYHLDYGRLLRLLHLPRDTVCTLWSLKYLPSGHLQKKSDNLCLRWFISLLALTQVNSKPESKLFGKIKLLFILGMFCLGTLIWVLIKLWKLSWTQKVCWRAHWQNCYRSFRLWLSIEPTFICCLELICPTEKYKWIIVIILFPCL